MKRHEGLCVFIAIAALWASVSAIDVKIGHNASKMNLIVDLICIGAFLFLAITYLFRRE